MKDLLQKNSLNLLTVLAAGVAIYAISNWSSMTYLQRLVSLFFVAIVMHVWEEMRYPGGFVEMIHEKLKFIAKSKAFGESVTCLVVFLLVFPPLLFPKLVFLSMAPMILGVLEAIAHTAMIKAFHLKRPYSPGLATAVLLLLPISIYGIRYAIQNDLMTPLHWVYSFVYMIGGLMLAQRYVIVSSGMKYSEFMRNVRAAVREK